MRRELSARTLFHLQFCTTTTTASKYEMLREGTNEWVKGLLAVSIEGESSKHSRLLFSLSHLPLFTHLSIIRSIYLSTYPYLSIYLPTYLSIHLSIYHTNQSIYPSVYVRLSIQKMCAYNMCVRVCVPVPVCVPRRAGIGWTCGDANAETPKASSGLIYCGGD